MAIRYHWAPELSESGAYWKDYKGADQEWDNSTLWSRDGHLIAEVTFAPKQKPCGKSNGQFCWETPFDQCGSARTLNVAKRQARKAARRFLSDNSHMT